MKPRPETLPVPEGPRFWSVTVGEQGVHHFRMPRYTVALDASERCAAIADAERLADQLPALAAAIGISWHHRAIALTTPTPDRLDDATFAPYAAAVLDELQDRYDLLEIQDLGTAVLDGLTLRLDQTKMAAVRANFTPAGESEKPAPPAAGKARPPARKRSST